MLNSNISRYSGTYNEWFREIKQELLISEPQNIAARAQCCQNIINESISHLNMQLGLNQLHIDEQYKCNIDARLHLKFLNDWPGLRIGSDSSKAPRTKREYEKKAKNWLNGRRAPNYGKTLFPHFISEAEQYANRVTKYLVRNNKKKQTLYYKILIYKVLAQLCGCSVSLNEQAKKAPFFCKNSIERKGKLKEILQAYAYDHQYIQGFPSCFEEAIDYFENKSNQYFAQYRTNYMQQQQIQIDNNNNNNNNNDDDRKQDITLLTIPKIESVTSSPTSSNHNDNASNISFLSHNSQKNKKNQKIDGDGDTVIINIDDDLQTKTQNNKNDNNKNNNNKNGNDSNIYQEMLFWKSRAQQFQSELEIERKRRMDAEKERDQLQAVFNLMQQNLNLVNNNNQNINNENINNLHMNGVSNTDLRTTQKLTNMDHRNNDNINIQTPSNNNNPNSLSSLFLNSDQINQSQQQQPKNNTFAPIQYGMIATPPRQHIIHNNNNNNNNNDNSNNFNHPNNAFGSTPSTPIHSQPPTLTNISSVPFIQTLSNVNNINMSTLNTNALIQNINMQNFRNVQSLQNLQSLQSIQSIQSVSNNNNQIGEQMAQSLLRMLQTDQNNNGL